MALLDAAYLLAAVRSLLAEYSSIKWTDDQINKWVQEAAMDISIKSLGYESIDTVTTAANTLEYNDPDDAIKIHAMVLEGTAAPCNIPHTSVSYDGDNPATIARNDDDVEITVSDGIGPFTWSVAGTGFSFDDAVTAGRSNILSANGSACGTATITVTDSCDDSDTGYVRCTTGQWVEITFDSCVVSGVSTEGEGLAQIVTRIEGRYKLYERWGSVGSGACGNSVNDCDADPDRHLIMGCTKCLEHGTCADFASSGYEVVCADDKQECCCITGCGFCNIHLNRKESKLEEWEC